MKNFQLFMFNHKIPKVNQIVCVYGEQSRIFFSCKNNINSFFFESDMQFFFFGLNQTDNNDYQNETRNLCVCALKNIARTKSETKKTIQCE